jgi:hypothetical protein
MPKSLLPSRRNVGAFLLVGSLFVLSLRAEEPAKFQVKTEKQPIPGSIKTAIAETLDEQALLVFNGEKPLACFWLRKSIPTNAPKEQIKNGLTYRELPSSTLIGVVELKENWKDFRRHEIEKGVYTLRITVQPTSDDHVGTAPHQDFCLLCPVAKDEKPDLLELKALVELSAESHGGTHPVVMLLFPYAKPEAKPKWTGQGKGIFSLNTRTNVTGEIETSLGFAFVLVGKSGE